MADLEDEVDISITPVWVNAVGSLEGMTCVKQIISMETVDFHNDKIS